MIGGKLVRHCIILILGKVFLTWISFSQKCSNKFDLEECKRNGKEFAKNYQQNRYQYNLTYIKNIARIDSPVEFLKFCETEQLIILVQQLKYLMIQNMPRK